MVGGAPAKCLQKPQLTCEQPSDAFEWCLLPSESGMTWLQDFRVYKCRESLKHLT
jgi:hypothetical protein